MKGWQMEGMPTRILQLLLDPRAKEFENLAPESFPRMRWRGCVIRYCASGSPPSPGGHSNGIDAGGKRIMIQPRELGKLQPALDPEPAMDPYLGPLLGTLFMENRKWGLRR